MTARRADIADLPDWPRLLSREQAAAYVGLSVNSFKIRVGREFPDPKIIGARKLWDRRQLDEAVDRLTGRAHDARGAIMEGLRRAHKGQARKSHSVAR